MMKLKKTIGFTLPEVIISIGLFGIISVCAYKAFHVNWKATNIAKINFENQTHAKSALFMMSHEIRNCRDLCRPSDIINWPLNMEVNSPFLSFQQYTNNSFSMDFSTVTYSAEQAKLYRYEDTGSGNISKRMILDNLLPGTSPFYLLLGDIKTTRKIAITLSMKNAPGIEPRSFSTEVFVQNPPSIGDNIYALP